MDMLWKLIKLLHMNRLAQCHQSSILIWILTIIYSQTKSIGNKKRRTKIKSCDLVKISRRLLKNSKSIQAKIRDSVW